MYKHWRLAEKRAKELETELNTINGEISKKETEARAEDIAVETRSELIEDIQVMVTKRDGLQKEYDEAIVARDKLKKTEDEQFGILNNTATPVVAKRHESMDEDIYASRSYELAWARYIRDNDDTEIRSLINTQTKESAGIMVPRTLVNKIEDTLRTGGKIIELCSIIDVKGITEYPIAGDRTDPELHKEMGGDSIKEKSIELYTVEMNPQFVAEMLRTTAKFEADSLDCFWQWLMQELPDALRRVIDRKILLGSQDTAAGIHGILSNVNSKFVKALANHELNFNSANNAVAMLGDGVDDNITILMNKKTFFNDVMGLKDTTGRPICAQIQSTNTIRPSFMMGGYPVAFSNELPAYNEAQTGDPYMLAGDFKAYTLNFPLGISPEIVRDGITEAHLNYVRYFNKIYAAGNITRLESFVKVTK